jgi:hypothetical protein
MMSSSVSKHGLARLCAKWVPGIPMVFSAMQAFRLPPWREAAETLANPNLLTALPRLHTSERTNTFVELLEDFGPELIEKIVNAYREFSLCQHPSALMYSRNTS